MVAFLPSLLQLTQSPEPTATVVMTLSNLKGTLEKKSAQIKIGEKRSITFKRKDLYVAINFQERESKGNMPKMEWVDFDTSHGSWAGYSFCLDDRLMDGSFLPIPIGAHPSVLTLMIRHNGKDDLLENGEQRPPADWQLKDKQDYKLEITIAKTP